MEKKLNVGEKLVGILNSSLSIGLILYSNFFKPKFVKLSIIIAIVVISVTIIYLVIRVVKQSSTIRELDEKVRKSESLMSAQQERISLIEKYLNVPFFKKWNLLYSFMWRTHQNILRNNVELEEINIKRHLHGEGDIKDNSASYTFVGKYLGSADYFIFCVAGLDGTTIDDINFTAYDQRNNCTLEFSLAPNTPDGNMKYIYIYHKIQKQKGDLFNIKLSWDWPRTTYAKSDYFAVPNIYGLSTKRIITEFVEADDMHVNLVETYKFGLNDENPVFIKHIYKDVNGKYIHIIEDPEQDADYITYFE